MEGAEDGGCVVRLLEKKNIMGEKAWIIEISPCCQMYGLVGSSNGDIDMKLRTQQVRWCQQLTGSMKFDVICHAQNAATPGVDVTFKSSAGDHSVPRCCG